MDIQFLAGLSETLIVRMKRYFLTSIVFLFAVKTGFSVYAEAVITGQEFRYLLGFEVSAHLPITSIQKILGTARTLNTGEFENAICYYRNQTIVTLTSFQSDDDSQSPDTFDMYEVSLATLDNIVGCANLPESIPDAAFQPAGLKLGMSIDQFKTLSGTTADDETKNGVKSSRVFQKFFSPDHYIYAAFDAKGLTNFRVQ